MLEASNTKNLTRPDNVFCLETLQSAFIQCEVKFHLCPVNTDHYPIISSIDLNSDWMNPPSQFKYHDTDWDLLNTSLANRLDMIDQPAELTNQGQFHTTFKALTRVISETVEEQVPKVKPSPYLKRWWSKDLDQERRHIHKIGRKARAKTAQRNHPIHEEYWVTCNRFSENIKKAKDSHWNEWLELLTETGIWNFHRYATSNPADQIHTRIKTLQDPQNRPDTNLNGT
jgi:hypothetical protein